MDRGNENASVTEVTFSFSQQWMDLTYGSVSVFILIPPSVNHLSLLLQ